jgi:hypothetical protein
MIDLHERLSEFSYGYGITREVEALLQSVGLTAVPFLPSLIHEDELGFDVGFNRPGRPLLLQFKLGQSLQRFIRRDLRFPAPLLSRPFFRFAVDTREPDGQFETLLKAELDGAEVYYVAPRFDDWSYYVDFFAEGSVLENSILVRPTAIRSAIDSQGARDGWHRIVYDNNDAYVCSKPARIPEVPARNVTEILEMKIRSESVSLGASLRKIYDGFDHRADIRRPDTRMARRTQFEDGRFEVVQREGRESSRRGAGKLERDRRLRRLRERTRSEEDAIAAAVGLELVSLGIQVVFVADESKT